MSVESTTEYSSTHNSNYFFKKLLHDIYGDSASPRSRKERTLTSIEINHTNSTVSGIETEFEPKLDFEKAPDIIPNYRLTEGVQLQAWKLIGDLSAKVISFDEDSVLLDCLLDREEGIYEEREFGVSLFNGLEYHIGSLFKIGIYERQNQQMIHVRDGKKLVSSSDFPKIDLFSAFSDLKLSK